MNLAGAIEQARITLMGALNYLKEVRNTETLRQTLAEFPQIYTPAVILDMTTSRVLTTELVHGRKVSKLTPLSLIDHDYTELAAVITRAYLKQVCVDGIWHSDPHPGNIFIRDFDGGSQVVLIDFGMVSRISREFQDEASKLLLAISSNRGTEVADSCVRASEVLEGYEATKFVREISTLVASFHDSDARQFNTGQLLFNIIAIANNNELKVPPELAMLAKTLLNLDGIHKIANRITVGMVIAALLLSSSLTLRYPTRATIFGYPAFAALGYLLAIGAAVYLLISTFIRDRKDEEKAKMKGR